MLGWDGEGERWIVLEPEQRSLDQELLYEALIAVGKLGLDGFEVYSLE